jgi:hypothetical protein
VIKSLADIAFKAFGYTNLAIRVKDNDVEASNVQMVGLHSATVIRVGGVGNDSKDIYIRHNITR